MKRKDIIFWIAFVLTIPPMILVGIATERKKKIEAEKRNKREFIEDAEYEKYNIMQIVGAFWLAGMVMVLVMTLDDKLHGGIPRRPVRRRPIREVVNEYVPTASRWSTPFADEVVDLTF